MLQDSKGNVHTMRYGQLWRDCTGDGLVLCLAQTVETLREQIRTPATESAL